MLDPANLTAILSIINTGGVVAVLLMNVIFFMKGELLPRKTYEDLTTRILKGLCDDLLKGFRELLKEEREQKGG